MGFLKLCCAAALGAVAQAAPATVYVRDSPHLFTNDAATDATPTLTEEDVSFLVSRVTSSRSPLESKPPAGLPVPDIFHEATGSLLLVATGVDANKAGSSLDDSSAATFALEQSSASADDAITNMLTAGAKRATVAGNLCVSLDSSIASACTGDDDATVVTWDADALAFVAKAGGEDTVINVDSLLRDGGELFTALGMDVVSDAEVKVASSGVSFDLTDAATVQMLAELQLFYQLPGRLNASGDAAELPEFTILSLAGLQNFVEGGVSQSAAAAANSVVSDALPLILDAWSTEYGDDQYQVAVLRSDRVASAGPRRVLSTSTPTKKASAVDTYTMEEIGQYQLFTWTWFLMLLIVFFAACTLGGVDIGKDDAGLYSNFKAGSYEHSGHDHTD